MTTDFDWAYGGSSSKLWNSGSVDQPVKTQYDPCPDGWRVPTYLELGNLKEHASELTTSEGKSGNWFSGSNVYSESVSSVFLPITGDRLAGDGATSSPTNGGKYWSSSPDETKAFYLSFLNTNKYSASISSGYRASGYAVRCVKE